ncbi:MAG TPA: 16S rRNA (cytidine(1402)-2'-O)-methyltransferase [Candidatus Paceibacterota bacterium]
MTENAENGKLSVVATPIGNLEDITLRALRILREADVIYAEDTRVTSKLLARYEIKKSLQRLDAATETKKANEIIARIERGEKVALVSDAGTPAVSDPGARLVNLVREAGANIETIPGASALTAAISISGLPLEHFLFLGFLPHKKGRQTAIKKIASSEVPVVLYESTHRIIKLLSELEQAVPQANVTIARELTKLHEEVISGTPLTLLERLKKGEIRGEFVVIIS